MISILQSHELCGALALSTVAAAQVNSTQRLFVWHQTHLLRFVPHKVSVIVHLSNPASVILLNSIPLPSSKGPTLESSQAEIYGALVSAWHVGGLVPRRVSLAELKLEDDRARRELRSVGLSSAFVHSSMSHAEVSPAMAFVFFSDGTEDLAQAERGCEALAMLLPVMHFAAAKAFEAAKISRSATALDLVSGKNSGLSAREIEVLRAVSSHRNSAAIGEILGISPLTVKNHMKSIMRKLNVNSRAQALGEAMKRGLM